MYQFILISENKIFDYQRANQSVNEFKNKMKKFKLNCFEEKKDVSHIDGEFQLSTRFHNFPRLPWWRYSWSETIHIPQGS